MIINCKCGKYQFDVKKSDIGNNGREVQCGICNEKWFYGNVSNKFSEKFIKSEITFKTPLIHKLIFLLIFITTLIGFLDLIKIFLIKIIPSFQHYFLMKQQLILKISNLIL